MKRFLFAATRVGLVLLLALFAGLFIWLPAAGMLLGVQAMPQARDPGHQPQQKDERIWCGDQCYAQRIGEMNHFHLAGDAAERGYASGVLGGEILIRIEEEMMDTFVDLVPVFGFRHLLMGLVSSNNRHMLQTLGEREVTELAASGIGHRRFHDIYERMSPGFNRALNYHALNDVSQYLIDSPLVNAPLVGCTAVMARDSATASGNLLVGRIFDFEGGTRFDWDKCVITVDPEHGQRYLSVAWPGVVGTVTGLNESGIWISYNSSVSDDRDFQGRPMIVTTRSALQHGATVDEVIDIYRQASCFISVAILVASAREDRVVVIEKTPERCVVREISADTLAVTNHFEAPEFADDSATIRRRAEGTTRKRQARARDLLQTRSDHTPASILEIMRDRRAADGTAAGEDVGIGNRGTINAWIAAHVAVADLKREIIWVCDPRHGLGEAHAFTVDGPVDEPTIPASPDLALWRKIGREHDRLLDEARTAIKAGDHAAAAMRAAAMQEINPNGYEGYWLAGLATDDPVERRALLQQALDRRPAYPAERQAIEDALAAVAE